MKWIIKALFGRQPPPKKPNVDDKRYWFSPYRNMPGAFNRWRYWEDIERYQQHCKKRKKEEQTE